MLRPKAKNNKKGGDPPFCAFVRHTGDFMFDKNRCVKIIAVFLMLIISVPFGVFSASASSDFTVENGVLLSYKGNDRNVSIPAEVYCIADYVFKGNKDIKSVELNNVTVIGNGAFRNCSSLSDVNGYDTLASCGAYAFEGTPFLEQSTQQDLIMGSVLVHSKAKGVYTIPAQVKSVAPYAFAQNKNLTSVTLGDNVSSVGEGAFWNCSALKSVSVSGSVYHIGCYAFSGTAFLASASSEFLIMGSGILVNVNSTDADIVIPSEVKQIGGGAFANNTSLKSVTIPEGVSAIGKRAFAKCSSLEKVEFPSTVVSIESEAFYNCTDVKSITVPQTVKILGDSIFLGCTSLNNAKVYTDAPLSAGLFAGCLSLERLLIANSPESVRSYAFYGCNNLKEMSLPGTLSAVSDNAFDGCQNLTVWCYVDDYVGKVLEQYGVNVTEIGDANCDSKLNVRDSTHIRKFIAGLTTLDLSAELKADTDFNGVINIRDATRIQKKLVGVV